MQNVKNGWSGDSLKANGEILFGSYFIEIMKTGRGEPIYTGQQGKDLCIFAKMPYVSDQRGEIVYWDEMTSKNEESGFCAVEKSEDADPGGLHRFTRMKRKDLKKGIAQGLTCLDFEYK